MKELYILASGVMADALSSGLKDDYKVSVVGRCKERLTPFSQKGFQTLLYDELDAENKVLILAFKPHALSEIAPKIQGKARLVISILANKTFEDLRNIKAENYVLAMPNIAAKYKASTTPFVRLNSQYKDEILSILSTFGKAFELESEKQMNAAMAISGCAPAFLALVAESIAGGGVYEGLKKDLSFDLTKSLFDSFCALFKHEHPAFIKEQICSPAGVTIKGIKILEEKAVRSAFFEALTVSTKR